MYNDTKYIPNLNKDIASFDIDFATNSTNGSIGVNTPSYPNVCFTMLCKKHQVFRFKLLSHLDFYKAQRALTDRIRHRHRLW